MNKDLQELWRLQSCTKWLGKTDLQKSPGKTQKFNTRDLSAFQKYLLLSENSIHGKRKTNRISLISNYLLKYN